MPFLDLADYSFLIVDDVRVTRLSLERMLKSNRDSRTFHAENGHQALALLDGEAKGVDCIITDFNMPVMHGLRMMQLIRSGHGTIRRDLPVIMVTGYRERHLFDIAHSLNVNAFLLKPVNEVSLLERVNRVLTIAQSGKKWIKPAESYAGIDVDSATLDSLEESAEDLNTALRKRVEQAFEILGDALKSWPNACEIPGEPLESARLEKPDPIRLETLQNELRIDDPADIAEVLEAFLEDAEPLLENAKKSVKDRDRKQLQGLSHALKGGANSAAALRLARLCATCQTHAASGSWDHIEKLIGEIQTEYVRVRDYARRLMTEGKN